MEEFIDENLEKELFRNKFGVPVKLCPKCQNLIGAMPGSRDAVCQGCGYKDPCCE